MVEDIVAFVGRMMECRMVDKVVVVMMVVGKMVWYLRWWILANINGWNSCLSRDGC